jgi:uncharacterized protein (DUF2236 family)
VSTPARVVQDNKVGLANQALLHIVRESVVFFGGGRAALLQLAHPYVAAALRQNSDLQRHGNLRRFQRTFYFMFKFAFGSVDSARAAAHTVRRLHQKARGVMAEEVGIFPPDHCFDANHTHALLWVILTLQESSIFM